MTSQNMVDGIRVISVGHRPQPTGVNKAHVSHCLDLLMPSASSTLAAAQASQ